MIYAINIHSEILSYILEKALIKESGE